MFPTWKHCWIIRCYFVGWNNPSVYGSWRGRICHGKAGELWSYERIWNHLGDKAYSERTWLSSLQEDYPPWYQTYVCGSLGCLLVWAGLGLPWRAWDWAGAHGLHLWEGGVDDAQQMTRSGSADNCHWHYLLIHFSGEDDSKVLVPLPFLSNSIWNKNPKKMR